MRGGVRELVRAGHVAARVDVGIDRLQGARWSRRSSAASPGCRALRARSRWCSRARPTATSICRTRSRSACPSSAIRNFSPFSTSRTALWPSSTSMPSATKRSRTRSRDFGVLAHHHSRQHLDLRHLRAEARERCVSSQPIGPPPSTTSRCGSSRRLPDRVRRQIADLLDARNRRHERPRAGGDHDRFRRQRLCGPSARLDLDRPRRRDLRLAGDALDAERRVALDRVVRLDCL